LSVLVQRCYILVASRPAHGIVQIEDEIFDRGRQVELHTFIFGLESHVCLPVSRPYGTLKL
jgi:hypothetical protein